MKGFVLLVLICTVCVGITTSDWLYKSSVILNNRANNAGSTSIKSDLEESFISDTNSTKVEYLTGGNETDTHQSNNSQKEPLKNGSSILIIDLSHSIATPSVIVDVNVSDPPNETYSEDIRTHLNNSVNISTTEDATIGELTTSVFKLSTSSKNENTQETENRISVIVDVNVSDSPDELYTEVVRTDLNNVANISTTVGELTTSVFKSSSIENEAHASTHIYLPGTDGTVLETTGENQELPDTPRFLWGTENSYETYINSTENGNNTNIENLDFPTTESTNLISKDKSQINSITPILITEGSLLTNMLNTSDLLIDENLLNTNDLLSDKNKSITCTRIFPIAITNTFKAYFQAQTDDANKTDLFEDLLRRYFPENSCNLFVTSSSKESVTWTDLSLNESMLCSKVYKRKVLDRIVNNQSVIPKFHTFFLPQFDIQLVSWRSVIECDAAKVSSHKNLNTLDITVYVFGSLLLLGVVTVVGVFLRGKTYESHSIDVNSTPNTYQKYTLRSRQPAFLSPEVHRVGMMATCNPAFVDDETVEPKARHFVEV